VRVVLALAACVPALAGCSSLRVGGAVGFDAGTLGVSGVEVGTGAQVEAIAMLTPRFGVGPSLQLAGYSTSGDGDPIWLTTLEARYRLGQPGTASAYLEGGAGIGLAWSPDVHHVAVPLQVELGVERRLGGIGGRVAIRERFTPLIGSGSPPLDALNSLQLAVGIRVGSP
jgi:hypothetical protein